MLAAILTLGLGARHPANVPVARAKVSPDGSVEMTITFDTLAFVLDQTPTTVLDAPMNALLDGPREDLQKRLGEAQRRFLDGFSISDGKFTLDSIKFPTANEIHAVADKEKQTRLPVMMTAALRAHLAGRSVRFRFADVLGTVVLTTEFPYQEPVSEPVEPDAWSQPLDIPTAELTAALADSMKPAGLHSSASGTRGQGHALMGTAESDEARARQGIQAQYDAWSTAYMAHDVDTLLGILAPSYTLKTAKGALIKRAEYAVMLNLRKQKHSDTKQYKTELLRLTLHEGVAAVFSRETTTDVTMNGTTGSIEPIRYQHDYIDVWTLTAGKWLLTSTVTQREAVVPNAR